MWDLLRRDVTLALRMLRRSPAFTLTATLTLALVIGANTAVFSLADAILLRPLPYPHPERLAAILTEQRSPRGEGTDDSQDGASWQALRDHATVIDVALRAGSFGSGVNLVVDHSASSVQQARVSAGYFRVLGVAPIAGREFTAAEDRTGGPAVAVLSYDLWQRVFAGDRAAVGRTLLLRGELYQVVGVMPPGFRNPGEPADVWTPARPSTSGEGAGTNYGVIARLRDGRTWGEAVGELQSLGRAVFGQRLEAAEPDPSKRAAIEQWWVPVPLQQDLVDGVRQPIEMLAGAVGLVLIIACVNLAALLLVRGDSRRRDIATRLALGSGRGAIVRQLLVESLVVGAIGGALGLAIGAAGLTALARIGGDTFRDWQGVTLDARAIAVTAGLSLMTSLAFGLVPALRAGRHDVRDALSGAGSRGVAGRSSQWSRKVLVLAEVALGVVLLVVTGLLTRTFVALQQLDPGFDPAHVTTATVSLQDARYTSATRINQLFSDSLDRLRVMPGVESAAVSLELPYRRLLNSGFAFADDPNAQGMANYMYVTPEFFATLKIPVRAGRVFTDRDRAGEPLVAIVNETFARSWGGRSRPILGRPLKGSVSNREIVGVVGDVQATRSGIRFPGMVSGPIMTTPTVFLPAAQASDAFFQMVHTWFSPAWSVRTNGEVRAADALQRAIHDVDPLLPVTNVRTLGDVERAATAQPRFLMTLVGVLACAAVLLAAIGLYGVIAQSVSERTREFGIRLALGAPRSATIRHVAGAGVALATVGAVCGLGLSWLAVRVLDSYNFLWGVGSHDPATYAGVTVVLLAVASLASLIPAMRVLRIDPARSLRE